MKLTAAIMIPLLAPAMALGQYGYIQGDCPGGVCPPYMGASQAAPLPNDPFHQPPQWSGQQQASGPQVPPVTGNTSAAIVRLWSVGRNESSGGSGVLIWKDDKRGLIASCAHTFDEPNQPISVVFRDGHSVQGKLLDIDRQSDLSVIEIPAPAVEPLAICEQPPQPGEPLAVVGYGSGDFGVSRGPLRSFVNFVEVGRNRIPEAMMIDTDARQGDSGGPILNTKFEVAGIIAGSPPACGSHCGTLRKFLGRFIPRVRKRQDQPHTVTPLPGPVDDGGELKPIPDKPATPGAPNVDIAAPAGPPPGVAQSSGTPAKAAGSSAEASGASNAASGASVAPADGSTWADLAGAAAKWAVATGLGGLGVPGIAAAAGGLVASWWVKRRANKLAAGEAPVALKVLRRVRGRRRQTSAPVSSQTDPGHVTAIARNSTEPSPAELENQSLRSRLAAAQQPVVYSSPPIGDNLPRMRQAMKLAIEAKPESHQWVKFFESIYTQLLGGEINA